MLAQLIIRDIVLIDRLDLPFGTGLTVLTGETGAGKSILLDSLGLALGHRADSGLVRAGQEAAAVTAEFELGADHPALALLDEAVKSAAVLGRNYPGTVWYERAFALVQKHVPNASRQAA